MKKASVIIFGLFFVAVSVLQYRMIAASLVSLGAWSVLVISHPDSFGDLWRGSLFEYWLAGVVWIVTAALLSRSIVRSGTRDKGHALAIPSLFTTTQQWSARAMGLISFVALTSPFLTPIDPDVQGNLVTTRLLPPFAIGDVREYLDAGVTPGSSGSVHQWFTKANGYLLRRTASVRGTGGILSPSDSLRGSSVVREFRMLFLFGTDDNGRDVFSRVVAGTRVSLGIGISAALGSLLIGAAVGFSGGLFRGILGSLLMRVTDLFLAIPSLLLVIGVLAFVGQSIISIVLVLSLSGWMGIARVVQGEVVSLREREFILAAKLLRVSTWKIVSRHLIPNLRPVIVTAAVLQFANAVLGEAALGFLGLGIQPPTASWGNMMGEATGYLGSAWWVGVFPGIFLALVIVSAHSLGENRPVNGNAAATAKNVV